MNRLILLCAVLLFLSGCGPVNRIAISIEASENKDNLQKIELGLSANQVKNIMGLPRRTEAFSLPEGNNYLVWYYVTEKKAPFRGLEDWNYTPMVFEKDRLTGWGYLHLDEIRKNRK